MPIWTNLFEPSASISFTSSGHVTTISSASPALAVIELPYPASTSIGINVYDSSVYMNSNVLVTLAGTPNTAVNCSNMLDIVSLAATVFAGGFYLSVASLTPVAGPLSILYTHN
jgi:hypothetical protein